MHAFMKAHAEAITTTDKNRGINTSQLPRIGSGSVVLMVRDYGEVRAADIYNNAYKRLRVSLEKIENISIISFLPFTLAILADRISSLSLSSPLGPLFGLSPLPNLGLFSNPYTAAPLTLLGIGAMAGLAAKNICQPKIDREFHAQFDMGAVRNDAPASRFLSWAATRALHKYFRDEVFARSLPYGEGLTNARPTVANREADLRRVRGKELLTVPVGADPETREEYSQLLQYMLNMLGDPSSWNRYKFSSYIDNSLQKLVAEVGEIRITKNDLVKLNEIYDRVRFDTFQRRGYAMVAGLFGAGITPMVSLFTNVWVITATLPLFSLGVYNAYKMAHSALVERRQYINGELNPNAPIDRTISKRAKRQVDMILSNMSKVAPSS